MATKNEVFTLKEEKRYNTLDNRIESAYKSSENSMLTIAGAIAVIAEEQLFHIGNYETIYDYCADKYGISRGSTSECINTWKKYGDITTGLLQPAYTDYSFSQLKLMRKIPAEVLLDRKIDQNTSARDLEAIIKSLKPVKAIEDSAKEVHTCEPNTPNEDNCEDIPITNDTIEISLMALDETPEAVIELIRTAFTKNHTITFTF